MLGDIFTKPLQGELFRKFRAAIMNVPIEMSDAEMGKVPADIALTRETAKHCPQECVGANDKTRVSIDEDKDDSEQKDERIDDVLGKKDQNSSSVDTARNAIVPRSRIYNTGYYPVKNRPSYANIVKRRPI